MSFFQVTARLFMAQMALVFLAAIFGNSSLLRWAVILLAINYTARLSTAWTKVQSKSV